MPAQLSRVAKLAWNILFLLPLIALSEAKAAAVVYSASGAQTTNIQPTVDQFRSDLGSLNSTAAGSYLTGRREVNWDGVPDSLAAPNNLPANFFNVNSPRGVLFSTPGTGLRVSADNSNSTATPIEFGDIDPNYPNVFAPFSPQRLFTAIGSNIVDVTFAVPGTSIPASVSSFGVVFSDVDVAGVTSLQFFDIAGNSLGTFNAPNVSGNETLSFLGIRFDAGERVARVRITSGNQVLAAGNNASDLVVMDDFIYSEPIPYPDVIAVNGATNSLLHFNSRIAGTIKGTYPVTGLGAGENLVGIDFRPATGQLYALAYNGSNTARLVTVPFTGGALIQIGNSFAMSGANFGFDFNPTVDRLRLTNDGEQNFSVNPDDGVVTVQTPLNPGNPNVVGSAYTNSVPGATTTQLFGIDSGTDTLVLQNPPASGTLTTRGPLGADTSGLVGFDIQGHTNAGYATLTLAGTSRLCTVDLDDGSVRQLATIGASLTVSAMTLVPQQPTVATPLNTDLLAVDASNNLIRFNSDTPGGTSTTPITGLVAGDTIHGIDVRPANQFVYLLGIAEGAGANDAAGRIYTVNPNTGAATPVGAGPFTEALADNAVYGFDFNPVSDRIRVVNSADQSLRVNPNNGSIVQFDTPLNSTGVEFVEAVAYDRHDLDPATATTLYAINTSTSNLEIIGGINGPPPPQSANGGVLNLIGPLGHIITNQVAGFDISPSGDAFAVFRAGSSWNLYSIDLSSGTAISRGTIGNGAVPIRGLTVAPQPCAIVCPNNVTVNSAAGQCGAVVNYMGGSFTGVCGPVTFSPPSGSFFPKGTTTVTATTATGSSCMFTVTVNDAQPPTITCPANITQPADPGQNGAVVTYGSSTVTDNCPGVSAVFSPASGSFFPVGTTTVNGLATDGSNNNSSCSFTVTVTAPVPTPTPTPTPPGLVANVATRLPVGTGDNVLIEGFIVQGPGGSTKTIIVRAIGPSLAPFGIPDPLLNPTLEIRDAGNTLIASNNDWRTTQVGGIITSDQVGEIEASGLAPTNDSESAIIANLPPGDYTAVVRGAGDTVGTGVVDAYDMSASSPARLANIATRGLIQPGDKLMIAGFIIQNGNVRAVVRAIGPSLAAFGINNALPDTTLEVRDQNAMIVIANDDWQSDPAQKQELEDVGLQPSDPREAAVIATLPSGQYTAQVRGKPESTGIGVVQVYFIE